MTLISRKNLPVLLIKLKPHSRPVQIYNRPSYELLINHFSKENTFSGLNKYSWILLKPSANGLPEIKP